MIQNKNRVFKNTVILPQIYTCYYYNTFYLSQEDHQNYLKHFMQAGVSKNEGISNVPGATKDGDLINGIKFFIENLPEFIQTFKVREFHDQFICENMWKESDGKETFQVILRETERSIKNLIKTYGGQVVTKKAVLPAGLQQMRTALEYGIIAEDFSAELFEDFKIAHIPNGGHVYFDEGWYVGDVDDVEELGASQHAEIHSWYFANSEKKEGVIFVGGVRKYWGVDATEQVKGVGTHLFSCLIQHMQNVHREYPLRFLEIFPTFEVVEAQEKNLIRNFALFNPLNRRVYTFYGLTDVALYLCRRDQYKEEARKWIEKTHDDIDLVKFKEHYKEEEKHDEGTPFSPEMITQYEDYCLRMEYLDQEYSSLLVCAGLCLHLRSGKNNQGLTLDLFRLEKDECQNIRPTGIEATKRKLKEGKKNNWIQCSCAGVPPEGRKNKITFVTEETNFDLKKSALCRLYKWLRTLALFVFCRYYLEETSALQILSAEEDLPKVMNSVLLHQESLKMENYLSPLSTK